MNQDYPVRKPNRLKNCDYCRPGAQFITICTSNRQNYFRNTVGARDARPYNVPLDYFGDLSDERVYIKADWVINLAEIIS